MIQIHWPASPITILILGTVLSSVGVAMVLTLHQANAKVCISGVVIISNIQTIVTILEYKRKRLVAIPFP